MASCEYIEKASKNVPLDVKIQLPSCVLATPFETSGATLSGDDKWHIWYDSSLNFTYSQYWYADVMSYDSETMSAIKTYHDWDGKGYASYAFWGAW